VRPGDPRSELVLSLFKEGNGLSLMLNGISGGFTAPDPSRVAAISPMAQLRAGRYHVPTFLIHGSADEIVPFHTAQAFADALRVAGIRGGLLVVENGEHIFDVHLRSGTRKWTEQILPGFEFLLRELRIGLPFSN
jgi:acetyl esterase/lipase